LSILYLADPDRTLWFQQGESPPIRIGEGANLSLARFTDQGELQAVVNDGETGGTLVMGVPGAPFRTLAERVVYMASAGVIANYDGQSGDLYRLEDDGSLTLLVERASPEGIKYDGQTGRILVLTDFDGGGFTLNLVDGCERTILARQVRPNSYQLTAQLDGVSVLHELDTESDSATLSVRLPLENRTIDLGTGVSEVTEVSWPEAGFLYSVTAGDTPGAWFSRIP
jgi:hypothetical protein